MPSSPFHNGLFRSAATIVPEYTENDVRTFVKMSLGNLYHEICHRYIHAPKEKNIAKLPYTYKSVFFILQNLHYLESGMFVGTKKSFCRYYPVKTDLFWKQRFL